MTATPADGIASPADQRPGAPHRRRIVLRLALLGLMIAALAAGAVIDLQRARDRAVDGALRHARNLALTLEVDAAAVMRAADRAALAVVDGETARYRTGEALDERPGGRLADAIRRPQGADHSVPSLLLAGPDGTLLASAGDEPVTQDAARALAEAYHRAPATAPLLTVPFPGPRGGDWRMAVGRPVPGAGGEPAAIAGAVIDLRRFARFYASLDVGERGMVTLWAADGAVLARHPQDEALAADPFAQAPLAPAVGSGKREQTLHGPSPLDGEERIAAVRAIEGWPLAVSVRMSATDYLAAWRQGVVQRAVETAALSAVLILVAGIMLRQLGRLEDTTAALRESERRSQAVFDSAFQIMGLLTPDGRVLAANRPAADLAGERHEDLAGRPAWEVAGWAPTPRAAEHMRERIAEAAAGRFVRYEANLESPYRRRVLDVSIKPVRDESRRVSFLVVEARDMTERKQVEVELKDSEQRMRSYLSAAMEGVFVSDPAGRYVDANPAACQLLGYSRPEILAMRVTDLIAPDHPLSEASLAGFRAVRGQGVFRGEMALRHKSGETVLAEVNAVRLDDGHFLGVIRDVTERRRAERALRASTGRLTALIRALPDLVLILDEEGVYREVIANDTESLLVAPSASLVGRRVEEVLPPDDARMAMEAIRRTLETGQPQRVDYALTVQAGLRWFEGRTQVLTTGFDLRPMVLVLTRDVTDRVLAAERLAAAKEQAETAARSKSTFLATMSHELRTPLNAIIGFSEIMLHELFGPMGSQRYLDYARNIQNSGRHLLELINDVLDMSKLEAGRYMLEEAWVEVPEALQSCLALASAPAEKGEVVLALSAAPELPLLLADERALRQVVLNLLSNAVKFTPPGGRVTVEAGLRPDGRFAVTVTDTGIGIAADALPRLAQPFQQADSSITRRFGGTGLGLSISRSLMELHGGSLEIASVEDEGTTVTLLFPAERLSGRKAAAAALTG
ncbi:PAS domain S-box protein [Azospirillum thermophilum]|uniref:histidine kinase n=1 Tax=Azospirillum thermophilum TaxID=2202148 RepID=A0A2S2CTG4_9PROT|nr:PAS domain S-box protein [Azospirillum thermophilum]AWK87802.1 hypothetical protein DEW08_17840 [Azospirillum thermophilum]